MSDDPHGRETRCWPAPALLLVCLLLVAAGYGAALLAGPEPAQKVEVVLLPAPEPQPGATPGAE
jgi:hypothetical protein